MILIGFGQVPASNQLGNVSTQPALSHGHQGQDENGMWYYYLDPATDVNHFVPAAHGMGCTSSISARNGLKDNNICGYIEEPSVGSRDYSGLSRKRKGKDQNVSRLTKKPKRAAAKQAAPNSGTYITIQNSKPEPVGNAPVLSQFRQALCETLPWFSSYQSSAYTNGGIVHGILLDAGVGPRDYFDDTVIISTM